MPTLRQLAHVAVALVSWLVFALLWVLLFRQGKLGGDAIRVSAETVGGTVLGVAIVTLAWVSHNLRIYRRKGPRKGRPFQAPRTDVDRLDRPVKWEFSGGHKQARKACLVVVELDGEVKRYRPEAAR